MQVILASTMGFCAGVSRAVEALNQVLAIYGEPVYVRHEIVHNRQVVEGFEKRGVRFIETVEEAPENAVLVFSAHGVAPSVIEAAKARNLKTFDATCPLVKKVHLQAARGAKEGKDGILVGHSDHVEVQGTRGYFEKRYGGTLYVVENEAEAREVMVQQSENVFVMTQTTLSVTETSRIVDILKSRYPKLVLPTSSDICYATENRQNALSALSKETDLVLVIGGERSSNTHRLVELSSKKTITYRIETAAGLMDKWLLGVEKVGVTAGASTPSEVVAGVIDALRARGATSVSQLLGEVERMTFTLPRELRELSTGTLASE